MRGTQSAMFRYGAGNAHLLLEVFADISYNAAYHQAVSLANHCRAYSPYTTNEARIFCRMVADERNQLLQENLDRTLYNVSEVY